MTSEGSLGILIPIAVAILASTLISCTRFDRHTKSLLVAGLWLRVIGALAYLYFIQEYYGKGDYNMYFRTGLAYAELIWSGEWSRVVDPWLGDRWWGTGATIRITGVILSVIGPTRAGAFILFGLIGYVGVVALGLAFMRAFPSARAETYFAWIIFFPSLWFWPAALGKDAIVLCGIGLSVLGFVGYAGKIRWSWLLLGILVTFAIRPQVATALVFTLVASHWMATVVHWTFPRIVRGVVLLFVGLAVVYYASATLDVELHNPDELEIYFDSQATKSSIGVSSLEVADGRIAIWLAPINVLMRPFPWEVSALTPLLASAEIMVLWVFAWYRRRQIMDFIRAYRRVPLFWVAVVFIFVYTVALGLSLSNLGMIARQRVHLLPFILMFFVGVGGWRMDRRNFAEQKAERFALQ